MRLSDNEKRDVIKLLQEGKPLPDKYRFLLFADDREVELVWNGKTQEACNLVLPFQTIEHVDEPRGERIHKEKQYDLFDTSGRQIRGWTNKLIWGDNKLILSSLKNGPMRREIEKQGGLKLIYIDSPFDVGADFSMNVEIGDPSTGSVQISSSEEIWTGGYIFENEWQSFRTKKDRKLELVSAEKEVSPAVGGAGKGRRKIAVKVVDIFGNDTTRVIDVNI